MFPRFTNALLAGCILVGLVLLGWILYSRAAFGTWNPTALPERVPYCGRTYLPGSHMTLGEIQSQSGSFPTLSLRQVGSTPDGKPILAEPLSDSERHAHGSVVLPCTMVVYVGVGRNDFVAYGLSGGP